MFKNKKVAQDYYQKHKAKIRQQQKLYKENNKEKTKIRNEVYRKTHIEEKRNSQHKYYMRNKSKKSQYCSKRRKEDIKFRILWNLRSRLSNALNGNQKQSTTLKLVGCSIEKLKQHLEKQFKIRMSWDNYGKWHIDHKIPCALFDLSKPSEQKKCFNYKNLQPLWAKENLKKQANYRRS